MKLNLQGPLLSSLIILSVQLCAALFPSQLIYEFPNPTFVENLAVRLDGSILTTLVTSPELYLIQPSSINPDPKLIYRFNGSTTVTGITEVSPDTFQVAVTTAAGLNGGSPVPGTSLLYRVAFTPFTSKAKVTLTTKLPDVLTPNGLATLNPSTILLADSAKGVIFAININTGVSNVAITDSLFAPGPPFNTGVNGLKILGKTLYFTNNFQNLLGKIDIDLKTATARGPASVVVKTLPPAQGYDDFALSSTGDAFLTNAAGNSIERVNVFTKQQTIVAGAMGTTDIAEPTAAAFGRSCGEDMLFVTTSGGHIFPVNGTVKVGGQVIAVMLDRKYIHSFAF